MGVGKSSFAYDEGQMDDDDLYRLRRSLFPDYPDGMNIKSLIRDPVNAVLFRNRSVFCTRVQAFVASALTAARSLRKQFFVRSRYVDR